MRRLSFTDLCLVVAIIGGLVLVLAAVWSTAAAAQAWLAAYLFWVGLPLGALYLTLAHGLTGGAWGITLRPALLAMLRAMPLLALFLVPVLIGAKQIYAWGAWGGRDWLALPFFAGRAVVYVVLWNVIALGIMRRARPDGWLAPGFAWPALILLFASTTLAAFDWLMTLEPRWTSTIFGLLVSSSWVLTGLAAAIAVSANADIPESAESLDQAARIMLAVVCLWGYFTAVQLIVIWESDLSHEIPWYLHRIAHGWRWAALAVAVCQFAIPFLILLWRPLRRSRWALLIAVGSALLGRLVENWWLSVPDFSQGFAWTEPVAFVAMGAAILFVGGRDVDLLPVGVRDVRR
jgi:hypothetical protein